jgi:hypothetical protein
MRNYRSEIFLIWNLVRAQVAMATGQKGELAYNRYLREVQALGELRPLPFCPANLCTLTHVQGDLFYSGVHFKAHAVAADLRMGRGFAAKYVYRFGPVERPRGTLQPGDVVTSFTPAGRAMAATTWLHVVTKDVSAQKLRHGESRFIESMVKGLWGLSRYCGDNGVRDLAVTTLGCGLDCLSVEWVCLQLYRVFQHTPIHVRMYHFV